uniref:Uncharacterized protein n=1 Tax=Cucumis melo TaxID=3656 RepID=A0A9I9D6Q1_CUCME
MTVLSRARCLWRECIAAVWRERLPSERMCEVADMNGSCLVLGWWRKIVRERTAEARVVAHERTIEAAVVTHKRMTGAT